MSSNTHRAGVAAAYRTETRLAARLEDDDLARLDVADVLRADDVEGGGLRGEDPAGRVVAPQAGPVGAVAVVRQPSEDERAEAVRVAHADDLVLGEDHEAERAADPRQHLDQGVDRAVRRLVGEERGQELRVGAGGEAAAPAVELARAARGC